MESNAGFGENYDKKISASLADIAESLRMLCEIEKRRFAESHSAYVTGEDGISRIACYGEPWPFPERFTNDCE